VTVKRPHTNLAILFGAAILVPLVVGSFGCSTAAGCPQGTLSQGGRCVLPPPEDPFVPDASTGADAAGDAADGQAPDSQIQDIGADAGTMDAGDAGDGGAKADAGDQEDATDTEAPDAADDAAGDATNDAEIGSAQGAAIPPWNANAVLLAWKSEGAAREIDRRLAAHTAAASGVRGGHVPSLRGSRASVAAARSHTMHDDHGHVRHRPDIEGTPRQPAADAPIEPGRAPFVASRGMTQEQGPPVG
jgi:hypothetical protein